MTFRLNAQHLALTYPQSGSLTKPRVADVLLGKLDKYKPLHYLIAQEEHKDGGNHFHCYIKLEKRPHISQSSFLDIDGHHGNYDRCKNPSDWVKYCTKEDKEPLTNMSEDNILNLKKSRAGGGKQPYMELVGKRLILGEEIDDLVSEFPQLIFNYKKVRENVEAYQASTKKYEPLPKWLPNDWGYLIPTYSREKRRHWWLFSRQPNMGKTTWAKRLQATYNVLIKTGEFTYWNINGKEDVIILDEYNTAKLRYDGLNQLADNTFEFRVFMGGVRRIANPYTVIVLSNQSIVDIYPHMNVLLYARFIEKELL